MTEPCPFCAAKPDVVLAENSTALAIPDAYPVTEGHSLVIPRKHVASIYHLSQAEQSEIWTLVAAVRTVLMNQFSVESFNIGFNDGQEAGQTVMHAHVHIVPRRIGDVADPRGGIRWVIADKAAYWK